MNKDEVTKLFDENTYPEWSQLECFRKGFALATVIRDKEWMAEPACYQDSISMETYSLAYDCDGEAVPLYNQPKEVK